MRYAAYGLLLLALFFALKAGEALAVNAGDLSTTPAMLAVGLPLAEAVLLIVVAAVMIERWTVEAQRSLWQREIELDRQARVRGLRRELLEGPGLSKNTF